MARITWDALGERTYEIGTDRGVFYSYEGGLYVNGLPWNGLTGVSDSNGGREASTLYSGGIKVDTAYNSEEYSGVIKCYTYPDEFEKYLGVAELKQGLFIRQQDRDMFGLCYRTFVGNDTAGTEYGYKLHLVYNCVVKDFSRNYSTVNESIELGQTEITFETYPLEMEDDAYKPISEIIIDSRCIRRSKMQVLEGILYGDEENTARLPLPDEFVELLTEPQPMPPEWYLYPNPLIYPDSTLYPEAQEG